MGPQSLVLIPGLLCDASVWKHQAENLTGLSNIIVPDLSKADSPEEMVERVLEVAPSTFLLAGHSMGGWVALEVMRVASGRVSRLALLNTSAFKDSAEKAKARQTMIAMVQKGESDTVIEWLLRAFVYKDECKPQVKEMLERNIGSFVGQEKAMLSREGCESVLGMIQVPTLIVHSQQDEVFNQHNAIYMHDHLAHSVLEEIPECGHMSTIEEPQKVTELMQKWLG